MEYEVSDDLWDESLPRDRNRRGGRRRLWGDGALGKHRP